MIANKKLSCNAQRFSVAPMLNWTDRHCRFFLRKLSHRTILYTEMITINEILFGKKDYLIYDEIERPLVLQLGGRDPNALAHCARIAQTRGYNAINLNVGCPSHRVQKGRFGACLMAEKEHVANCIAAMRTAVSIPVTVKTRIGINDQDSYAFLYDFINTVSKDGGCDTFIIHARKAWLVGLNPKENRKIPSVNYELVYQLKQDFPTLTLVINGEIKTLRDAKQHLQRLDGVMIGREAYQNPGMLIQADSELFNEIDPFTNQTDIVTAMLPYIEQELSHGVPLNHITRHMLGLFQGISGAKRWRRYLSEYAYQAGAGAEVVSTALSYIQYNE